MSTHEIALPVLPLTPRRDTRGRRGVRVSALVAAALGLHAVILGGADWVWPTTAPPPVPAPVAVAAVQVRVVEADMPAAHAVFEPSRRAGSLEPRPLLVPANATAKRAVAARAMPEAQEAATTTIQPSLEAPGSASVPAAVSASVSAPVSASNSADDQTIPLYRTQPPSAATLRYEVSRGELRGLGELVWRPQGDRYELTLDFKLAGLTILSQSSTGGFDAAGLAPLRFTDQRPRRGTTAANFQREASKISYSGSSNEAPLQPGAQDRLSWMLQLAAIVSAEPQLAAPGARVVMAVTGARGDAGVWVFRCIGPEAVDTRGGATQALKFLREPREPYDTTVQVWLDPNRQHLPVRATQKSGAGDEVLELRLLERIAPN